MERNRRDDASNLVDFGWNFKDILLQSKVASNQHQRSTHAAPKQEEFGADGGSLGSALSSKGPSSMCQKGAAEEDAAARMAGDWRIMKNEK